MAKTRKDDSPPRGSVRTRRAYFDCRFGQLHVRTAFPTTGGFDEGVTLVCLHGAEGSSRTFARFLPDIAGARSVYAPDLPGSGESDAGKGGATDAAEAVSDLADSLRLRQIDLLGLRAGAAVALQLAVVRMDLVRRLILVGVPTADSLPQVKQSALVLRTRFESPDGQARIKAAVPNARIVELAEYAEDLFEAVPAMLAERISEFLGGG